MESSRLMILNKLILETVASLAHFQMIKESSLLLVKMIQDITGMLIMVNVIIDKQKKLTLTYLSPTKFLMLPLLIAATCWELFHLRPLFHKLLIT